MIGRDLLSNLSLQRALSPVTQTNADTAFVSQIIDVQDLMSLCFAIMIGTWSDANATSTVLVEYGDASDLSDNVAVPDAELLPEGTGQEASAAPIFSDDNAVKTIGVKLGTKRYYRVTVTPSGNDSGALPIAILAIGEKRFQGTGN